MKPLVQAATEGMVAITSDHSDTCGVVNGLDHRLRAQRWQHPQRHARWTRSWKTTLLAATTSSATACTRPSPNSWRRPLPPSALRGAVPGSDAEARAHLGDYFAETLLLDQGTSAAKARSEIGWQPSHATLGDEFLHGNWRRAPKAGSRPTVPGRGCFGLGELVRWPRSRGGTTAGWRTWWFW